MTSRESKQRPTKLEHIASPNSAKQMQWSVEVAIHVLSIFAQVKEQRSFHVPVTCTGHRNTVLMFDGLGGS